MNKIFLFIAITLFFSVPIIAEELDYTLIYGTNSTEMISDDVTSDFELSSFYFYANSFDDYPFYRNMSVGLVLGTKIF